DGFKLAQLQSDGQIAASALLADFTAFDPAFRGSVSVAAGDINHDNLADLVIGAGAGGGPEVRVIDAAKLGQVQADGQIGATAGPGGGPHVKIINGTSINQIQADGVIAASAVISGFFTDVPTFSGGVFIASDADHRDGPINGPPGVTITSSRSDINDIFLFQSP